LPPPPPDPNAAPRIWIDIEDLFEYATGQSRPSGIQRLVFELCSALVASETTADRIAFLRHDPAANSFRIVDWAAIETLYAAMTRVARPPPAAAAPPVPAHLRAGPPQGLRELAFRLSPDIRLPLTRFYIQQREALRALGALVRAVFSRRRRNAKSNADSVGLDGSEQFSARVRPGDVILAPGAHWYHPNYAGLIEQARRDHGIRFALLVYDIIPLRRPEWCEPGLIRIFTLFMNAVLPLADSLFTISRFSAADILRHAAENRIALRSDPVALPIGTGFREAANAANALVAELDVPKGPYILVVATIEARKNHLLLFHVWRRLLDEMPRESVPTLVMAGRLGWLVEDLFTQLRNCDFLGGKIVQIESASDGDLEALYAGCLFSVFPSFYEGWGLPVTESFSFGRPCVISNATSLPEAGGDLARYFDPANTAEAYAVIRELIEQPETLRALRERTEREFQPVPWRATAEALVEFVDRAAVS
jgi:glycosyltransferase involved in cell wall biosynthesis